jgi:hypothetical protein
VKFPTFTERYMPPREAVAWKSDGDDSAQAWWFPWHLLLEQLGRCCAGRCDEPTAYVLAGGDHTYLPVCDEHVCTLAHTAEGGNARGKAPCPKCHCAWTVSGEATANPAAEPSTAGITPDEIKRLRLEPGDRYIVRVADSWTPHQVRAYQDHLRTQFPDNQVLVLPGEQVLTAGPGGVDEQQQDPSAGELLGAVVASGR